MGWLIAALIIGGLATAAGGIIERIDEREQNTERAQQEKDQLEFRRQQLEYGKTTALGTMEQELGIQKAEVLDTAADTETSTIAGFSDAMENTYLSQLGAELEFSDLHQERLQAGGTLSATAGASGLQGNELASRVLDSQFRERVALKRKMIDSGLASTVMKGKTMADLSMGEAAEMRAQFNDGSSFMNLYNYKRDRIQGAADIDALAIADQQSYLDDVIKDNTYNWKWFAADAFGVLGAGANTYTSGYGKAWGV